MPLVGRMDNQYKVDFEGRSFAEGKRGMQFTLPNGQQVAIRKNAMTRSPLMPSIGVDEAARKARDAGATSLRVDNIKDPGSWKFMPTFPQGNEVVFFDPSAMRSVNAIFDPELKHLGNLGAAVGGSAVVPWDILFGTDPRNNPEGGTKR